MKKTIRKQWKPAWAPPEPEKTPVPDEELPSRDDMLGEWRAALIALATVGPSTPPEVALANANKWLREKMVAGENQCREKSDLHLHPRGCPGCLARKVVNAMGASEPFLVVPAALLNCKWCQHPRTDHYEMLLVDDSYNDPGKIVGQGCSFAQNCSCRGFA